jgi:hypothetical protein
MSGVESRAQAEEAMVDALAVAMKAKLARAREKGRGGWDDPADCSVMHLWDCLHEHSFKGNLDFVDVANIAGMVWWRVENVPGDREALSGHLLAQAAANAELRAEVERLRAAINRMAWRMDSRAADAFKSGAVNISKLYEACADIVSEELKLAKS